MGNVVEFPALQTDQPRARHELFVSVTQDQSDRFSNARLGLIEYYAAEGARRVPINVDMAALTIATPHINRALRKANVLPHDVRVCIDGPPLDDYALDEPYPAMKGHHIRLAFTSADDKERFACQYGAVEGPPEP